jgi:hypothetical protein
MLVLDLKKVSGQETQFHWIVVWNMLYLCRIASLNVLTCGMSQANVQQYYQQFEEQQIQSLIDQEVKELLCQMVAAFAQQQIGGPFHQNLATLQSGQYKPLPSPSMPPSMHLIVLQPPSAPTSGTL